MRMDTCSVHTTGGRLMGVGLVLESHRQHQKGPRLVLLSLRGHVPPGFQRWFPKVFSLFGLMRMVGKELKPPNPPCK